MNTVSRIISFLFAGQGFHFGINLADLIWHPAGRGIVEKADNYMRSKGLTPFSEVVRDGDSELLNSTLYAQLLMYVAAMAALEIFKALYPQVYEDRCKVALGHSAAEIAALVSMGFLTFEQGLSVVYYRGLSMQQSDPAGVTMMIKGKGADLKSVQALCNEILKEERFQGAILTPTISQTGIMTNVGGDESAIARLEEIVEKKKGLQAERLGLPFAFHTVRMNIREFSKRLHALILSDTPHGSVVSNFCDPEDPLLSSPWYTSETLIHRLKRQARGLVQWTYCVEEAARESALCVRMGHGRIESLARSNAPREWKILPCGNQEQMLALGELL